MMNSAPLNRVNEFIKASAFLLREYMGLQETEKFLASRKTPKIIYLYDTDVLVTKTAPWRNGPLVADHNNHFKGGYGQLLPGAKTEGASDESSEHTSNEDITAEIIADILASYALKYRILPGETAPSHLFQLPSHYEESRDIFRAVRRAADRLARRQENVDKFRERYEIYRISAVIRQGLSTGDEIEGAIKKLITLLNLYSGSFDKSASHEVHRLNELQVKTGEVEALSPTSSMFESISELTEALQVLDPDKRTTSEQERWEALTSHWKVQFSSSKRSENSEHDAQALANLYLLNSRLSKSDIRFVLVTGDRHLVTRLYDFPTSLHPDFKNNSVARNFSLRYIRHLWSFSSQALIQHKQNSKNNASADYENIFVGLLAKLDRNISLNREKLEDLINKSDKDEVNRKALEAHSLKITDDDLDKVLVQWRELTKDVIAEYRMKEYGEREVIREAILKNLDPEQGFSDWDIIISRIHEDVERERDRTFLAFSDLGLDTLIKDGQKIGTRTPPSLYFDSLSKTNEIFTKLTELPAYKTPEEFQDDFDLIEEDCPKPQKEGDDRQVSHLKLVVLGAAFCSADKWLAALVLAKRAIAIVQRSRKSEAKFPGSITVQSDHKSHISGREAYFLAASCQRNLAKDREDIDAAREFLRQANNALKLDQEMGFSKNVTPLRFLNEELSVAMSQYYLDRQKAGEKSGEETDYCHKHAREIYRLCHKVLNECDLNVNDNGEAEITHRDLTPKSRIYTVTQTGIAVNLLQIYVLQAYRKFEGIEDFDTENECAVNLETLEFALQILQTRTDWKSEKAEGKVVSTQLMKCYGFVGEKLLSQNAVSQEEIEAVFGEHTDHITHYDEWRFNALKQFANRLSDITS